MKKRYLFFLGAVLLFLFPKDLLGQNNSLTVSGRVTSEDNDEGLPGVNVLVKGTTTGTVTDVDGNYRITVPENAETMVFSSVGYTSQEVAIGNRTNIDVQLPLDVQSLSEIVVVGYGEQSREVVTSSVSKISTEEVQNQPYVNPIQALQGKAAGLDIRVDDGMPGRGADVIIRGGTSTSPGNDGPLYVIDGVFRNNMNDLNSEDIESIQVLKDAASTAIYGARGANGIIVVTTKKGGLSKGKGQFTVDYSTQVETLGRGYSFSNAEDYIWASRKAAALELDDVGSSVRLSNGAYPYSTNTINNNQRGGGYGDSRYTVEFLDDLIAAEGQGYVDDKINNEGYQTMTDPVTGRTLVFLDNDYSNSIMFQTGLSHNVNLGFSGGTEKANIYSSLGYNTQEGTINGTYYDRFSFLLNTDFEITDKLRVNGGASFQRAVFEGPRDYNGTVNRSARLPHTTRVYYDDGTPAIGEGGGSPRSILHELYYEDYKNTDQRLTLRFGADWEIAEGLHFKPSGSIYMIEEFYNYFERFHEFDQNRNMSSFHDLDQQVMFDGILTYDKSINNIHNFSALLGTNYTQGQLYELSGSGRNAPTDYISTLNASRTEDERVSSTITDDVLLSYFSRVNYDFDQKYLFSVSARMDGSSRFASENKWGFFPAVSAGWNIHREAFWNANPVSTLKLRSSWGEAGNNVLALADTQGEYSPGFNYTGAAGTLNTRLANSQLIWETTRTLDVGVDVGLFNGRMNVFLDYYEKLTRDRLIDVPLPRETGFTSIRDNVGSLRNRGFEVELNANIIQKGDFNWNASGTFSLNRLVVVDLPENGEAKNRINGGVIYDKDAGEYVKVGGIAEGERINGVWAFHMTGVYATDDEARDAPYDTKVSGYWLSRPAEEQKVGGDAIWEDLDQNDTIDNRDLIFMGYTAPDIQGGIVNTFSWKGLNLRVAMNYAMGHIISNGWRARANGNARNRVMTTEDVTNGNIWWEQGDQTIYPRYSVASDWDNGKRNHFRRADGYTDVALNDSYATDNSVYFSKGDFLAFREVSLTYQLPGKIVDRLNLTNVSFSAGGYNLGYITGFDGVTPEHYNGRESDTYYRPRQYKFGVRVTF